MSAACPVLLRGHRGPSSGLRRLALQAVSGLTVITVAVTAWAGTLAVVPGASVSSLPSVRPAGNSGSARSKQTSSGRRDFLSGRAAWDDAIPDLPEEYRQVGPLKFGPRPRPFGLLLMPILLSVYFAEEHRKTAFRRLDANGDQQLTQAELANSWPQTSSSGSDELTVDVAFQSLDADRDGFIGNKEWLFSLGGPPGLGALLEADPSRR
ncbi:unnamed protein product [Polarella glacialis]|uniref:EF-hand domain-containing protein n=1 Tax=Polarella glacialis TaxID=89957 RepID=A0A813FDL2_POLGL|nr:unnamed protein product [Polarella glacialis]